MLKALELTTEYPIIVKSVIFEDNNGAISTATTPKISPCTKHIAVKHYFVQNLFGKKRYPDHYPFDLQKIDAELQKADVFTKGLTEFTFLRIRKLR